MNAARAVEYCGARFSTANATSDPAPHARNARGRQSASISASGRTKNMSAITMAPIGGTRMPNSDSQGMNSAQTLAAAIAIPTTASTTASRRM